MRLISHFFPLALGVFFLPSGVHAKEMDFAAMFVKAHHDYADSGATEAIATLDKAIKIADNPASRQLAETFLFSILKNEGRVFSDDSLFADDAIQLLNRANKLRPDDPFVLLHLGYANCNLNQLDSCFQYFSRSIAVAEGEQKARYYQSRGTAYGKYLSRVDLEIKDLRSAQSIYQRYSNTRMVNVLERTIKLRSGS